MNVIDLVKNEVYIDDIKIDDIDLSSIEDTNISKICFDNEVYWIESIEFKGRENIEDTATYEQIFNLAKNQATLLLEKVND